MKYIVMVQKQNNMHCLGSLEYIERSNLTCTNKMADHICENACSQQIRKTWVLNHCKAINAAYLVHVNRISGFFNTIGNGDKNVRD